ncbi:50S ribosomal protein L24 [Candidatus Pacearchaeota archaeon]|nr:50S ribosomal protein L24 [Candidatus Pacearchaeota archaeon]
MKNKFSKAWKGSSQPRKQRKYLANAPMHLRKKFMSVNLSKDLRKKYGKRNVPVKRGDTVKVMRGKYYGKQGKITEVSVKRSKIMMEGIQVMKRDGSKVNVRLRPSNLQIIELNMEGKNRIAEKSNKNKTEKKNAPQKTASS